MTKKLKELLFKDGEEYTREKVRQILKENNYQYCVKLFYNVYGWDVYYTTQPTFATPTGVLKGFPREETVYVYGTK